MTPLIGPVSVGKSTCMDYIACLDDDFGRVQGFTTRPQRSGEAATEYRFLPHDEQNLRRIASLAMEGELVQYAVHPTTNYLYGSEMRDYGRRYMMLDTLASNIGTLRRIPFGTMTEITIVATPQEWLQRFTGRNSKVADAQDANKRIREGQLSIEWSLEQGEAMIWVCNFADRLPETGQEIRDLIKGRRQPDPKNRQVGEQLLKTLQGLL